MRMGLTRAVESLQTIDAPLVEIDHWVEGICPNYKLWQASTGEGCQLGPDNIVALRALQGHKNETGNSETDKAGIAIRKTLLRG
jgi:hypothetical protein